VTAVLESISPGQLRAEWQRVELLGRCLLQARAGKRPEPETLKQLKHLQRQVSQLRATESGPWARLPVEGLSGLALDVLACVYAAEAQPQVGLMYQDLQGLSQSYPSAALVQVLLALDDSEVPELIQLTHSGGELSRRRLLRVDGEGVFAPLKPEQGALRKLLDLPGEESAPPGAVRVQEDAGWDDLVLPADRRTMIREYLLWLQHRETVVGSWGGKRTGGPVALFCGPSGTGKTLAASVVAGDLGWPLFRVDLARLVSKYIGETEKNIGRLFDAAHGRPMVLLFDEVDALMSKRGEVKDARDRYANMEVSYLLTRIEDHHGPCILATNLRNQIDKAFIRRFQMVVEFPRPDEAARAQLWQIMLPPRAPLAQGVDTGMLARAVNLTGGNIRNAALHAAYLAAEEGGAIDLPHIAVGVLRELFKDRPQVPLSDLGGLEEFLPAHVADPGTVSP
jgi:hypothetical protein